MVILILETISFHHNPQHNAFRNAYIGVISSISGIASPGNASCIYQLEHSTEMITFSSMWCCRKKKYIGTALHNVSATGSGLLELLLHPFGVLHYDNHVEISTNNRFQYDIYCIHQSLLGSNLVELIMALRHLLIQ